MGKSRKDYEKYLNSISPDRDDEAWIIGGKNRYCGRENYGTMIKRCDPIGFNVGYREWGGTARVRRSPPWHEVSLAVCGQAHILIR